MSGKRAKQIKDEARVAAGPKQNPRPVYRRMKREYARRREEASIYFFLADRAARH